MDAREFVFYNVIVKRCEDKQDVEIIGNDNYGYLEGVIILGSLESINYGCTGDFVLYLWNFAHQY